MREAAVALLLALAVAGTTLGLVALLPSSDQVARVAPGEEVAFGFDKRVLATQRFCGDCHYGLREIWSQDAVREGDDVRFRLANAYNTTLHGVEVFGGHPPLAPTDGVRFAEGTILSGERATVEVDVPDNASGLYVHADGRVPDRGVPKFGVWDRWNFEVTFRAETPSGETLEPTAADAHDLRVLALNRSRLADAGYGTWRLHLTYDGGPRTRMRWNITSLVSDADRFVAEVPFERARGAALPRRADGNYTLRLWPFHDHTGLENRDWDPYDTSPFVVRLDRRRDTAPTASGGNVTNVSEVWDDRERIEVLDRTIRTAEVWYGTSEHDDPGPGSSYPYFGPTGDPVPPGTERVVLELTWTRPEVNPEVAVTLSPAGTPNFLDPPVVDQGSGMRRYRVEVQPSWWDDPNQERSDWDIAPYVREREGDVNRFVGEIHLVAWAVR